MSETGEVQNPREAIGGNNPPAPIMPVAPDTATVEAAIRHEHGKFIREADDWIESVSRAPAVIENAKQAEAFAKTISELNKAARGAEKVHATLKKPWFEITKAIDAIFLAGVVKRADAAASTMVARQKVWLSKVEKEARKAEEARAAQLKAEADAARAAEEEKLREAERAMDQGRMDEAQDIMGEAVRHSEEAAQAEQDAAQAIDKAEGKTSGLVRQTHSVGVTTSARTFTNVELLSRTGLKPEELLQFWAALAPFLGDDVLLKAAKAAARAGLKQCPGLRVFEDFSPINR